MAILVTDRKSTRLNSSHSQISYAVFCLKKKNESVVPAVVVNGVVVDPTVSENVPAPMRSAPPENVEAPAACCAAASWSMLQLPVPGAGLPVTVAPAAPDDVVAVTIAPMEEELVRAAAADCSAASA